MTRFEPSTELIERAVAGEEDASRRLFDGLRGVMRGMARKLLGGDGEETVEDVVQDVLLKVHRTLHRFDPTRGVKFSSWALTYCRNHCYDMLKKKRVPTMSIEQAAAQYRQGLPLADVESTDPARALEGKEFADELREAVLGLDALQQEIYELRVERGLNYQEVSERVGVHPGTAKSRLHRARRVLRQRLAAWNPYRAEGPQGMGLLDEVQPISAN